MYAQQAWRRADGQHFVRMWWTEEDGSRHIADRPTYPDRPVHVARPEPKEKTKSAIPPPAQPAREIPVDDARIPKTLTRAIRLARDNGWRVRVTHAVGPRVDQWGNVTQLHMHTLAVRCFRGPGEVVVLLRRYDPDKAEWVAHGAYDAPWSPCGITQAEDRLKATS